LSNRALEDKYLSIGNIGLGIHKGMRRSYAPYNFISYLTKEWRRVGGIYFLQLKKS
jgi:hypothetical protein